VSQLTGHLLVQIINLGVGIVYDLVHLYAQVTVLIGQRLGEIFLVDTDGGQRILSLRGRDTLHLLCGLISPKCKTSASTFHDGCWAHATEYTRLVVLRWVEQCRNRIVRVGEAG